MNQILIAYMRHHIVPYPKRIIFLLEKYASNGTIIQTQYVIKNLQKIQNQRAYDIAHFIRSRTSHCGCPCLPTNQIDIFIHGIAHKICEQPTLFLVRSPRCRSRVSRPFYPRIPLCNLPRLNLWKIEFESWLLLRYLQIDENDALIVDTSRDILLANPL